ncbi:MAG TPA: SBBP repeat-containing protein, partial [Anaerolineales bacterium]|nr:SBBP repeat-containing protein [Anaerolineales bacterium]
MKTSSKFVFSMLAVLMLLAMMFGAAPVQSVRAEAAESPLAASGDYVGVIQMGGDGEDKSSDIAVDLSGNIYTTGYFYGTADFAPGLGVFNLTSSGYEDIFISKLNVDGSFAWAKSIGGKGWLDNGNGIAVDVNGNVYITGSFTGTVDFDPGIGIFNLASVGYNDAFISKLDNNGNFVWAKNIGGTSSIDNVVGRAIAMDSGGNVFITGYFNGSADFDPGASEFNLTSLYGSSAYILKLNNNGEFVFAKSISGVNINDNPSAVASGIAIDSNNAVYTTGIFYGVVDFDPGSGTFNLNGGSSGTGFLSKLDMNGKLVWAQSMGLVTNDIVLDSSNNAYVTGSTFESINSSGIGADSPFPKFNILVSKLDSNGNLVWKKNMGSA